MKKAKKHLIALAVLCILPLLLVGGIIYIIDPFFVYHKPLEMWNYVIDNQLEQNPGVAKQFEYDSVMLGSSMTVNFDTLLFDEKLGTKMVKLSYNAAYPKDIDNIMRIVKKEKGTLNHAFLCVDIANYMKQPGTLSYPHPEHLYDANPLNDLKYLLNKEVLLSYVVDAYVGKKSTPVNEMYWHWQYMTYGRDHVLSNYTVPTIQGGIGQSQSDYSVENLEANLDTYIIPYIEAMPETQWDVFFPPYSMLYWYDSVAAGEADIKIDGMSYVVERLLKYDNVNIHFFHDVEEWICDLDNYTDETHYSKQITDVMTDGLCDGTSKVEPNNYEVRLEMFREFVENFDYKTFVVIE